MNRFQSLCRILFAASALLTSGAVRQSQRAMQACHSIAQPARLHSMLCKFVKYISVLGVNCTSSITSNKSLKLMDQSKTHHFTVCFLQASRIVHRSSLHRSWGGAHSGQEVHFHKLEPDGIFHQGLKHKCTAQLNSCNPNLYHKLKRVANTYHDLQWQT
jgi:hypothetical protein